ncbi:hypothetical protein BK764_00230 [Bacillus thuringiensis serovar israelensis]|uniref:Uncharacterized protein n=2 Tax=Bacillus thuringiensis TaxID=1428 RepID=A0A242WF42_BACTU|nr:MULTISPECIES: hypothetical protein [Bacillus cereus group]EEM58668.1 hypothetical protein bthur0007_34710 [Bacillus thuringiensis serovar monterrey BGSC 4AJ1]MEB9670973.1 hypothetical protein [Bacillus anthracis]OTW44005.1 hypothetical protein BK699_33450 [Bacillus thuringiensis serovar mexicanensis]OTW54542.1 hypothetical protein BK699_03045 [Bacillus thuringiensis serovar mexicanensis]OTW55038.1 hypothetical protein BK699_02130 [Bacillus thuringiensis serovar mexicanensis]
MDEAVWRTTPHNTVKLKPVIRRRIDPNKIQSVQDILEILKRIPMYVDDEAIKGIEHLIADDND